MNLYDVVAVNIRSHVVRILEHAKDEKMADSVVQWAVMRRGVDSEFYVTVPAGTVAEGSNWLDREEGDEP